MNLDTWNYKIHAEYAESFSWWNPTISFKIQFEIVQNHGLKALSHTNIYTFKIQHMQFMIPLHDKECANISGYSEIFTTD